MLLQAFFMKYGERVRTQCSARAADKVCDSGCASGPHDEAAVRGAPLEDYALAWLARQPEVSHVLVGMTKEEYVDAAVRAVGASTE